MNYISFSVGDPQIEKAMYSPDFQRFPWIEDDDLINKIISDNPNCAHEKTDITQDNDNSILELCLGSDGKYYHVLFETITGDYNPIAWQEATKSHTIIDGIDYKYVPTIKLGKPGFRPGILVHRDGNPDMIVLNHRFVPIDNEEAQAILNDKNTVHQFHVDGGFYVIEE